MDLSIIGEITSPSEVNVSAPPYRLFMSTLLTYNRLRLILSTFHVQITQGKKKGRRKTHSATGRTGEIGCVVPKGPQGKAWESRMLSVS